ncbi:MAG: recombinase family protein [Lachnospiraceae bacterium]|nr:recombinase family protein [Lachnospiraceae bacterium]
MASHIKEFRRNPGNEAYLYCRYSSDAQRDVSIDQQIAEAKIYAEKNNIKIVKTYTDKAITGTTMERPGLQTLLVEARTGRPAYLLTWKLDRLSREIHDSFAIDAMLLDMGVELVTIAEPLPEDQGIRYAMQGLYAAMAHTFIINHRSNVKRGLKFNAEHCLYNGVKILGYTGERNTKYKIDPATAPIVMKIFQEYADGKPLQKIANELNEAGYKTVQGNSFVVNSLRHILNNRTYLGEYRWGKGEEQIVIQDGLPRLISDELFEKAQERLAENKHGGKGGIKKSNPDANIEDFWLTSHIYCGECGSTMQGTSGKSHTGKRHYYYSCKEKRKHSCTLKDVRKDTVEQIVLYALDELIMKPENRIIFANLCYEYYTSQDANNDSLEKSLELAIKDVDRQVKNIMNAIKNGVFNDFTQNELLELKERKDFLTEELEKEKLRLKCRIKLEDIVRFFDSFAGNMEDKATRQRILDIFVDKVIVYKDKLAITMHFSEDTRELSINDTEELIKNRKRILDMLKKPCENENNEAFDMMQDFIMENEETDFFA